VTLDLSSSTAPEAVVAGAVVAELTNLGALDAPFMLIGATARDLHSLTIVGTPPARATRDVDIAVAVPSWHEYDEIVRALERAGRHEHAYLVARARVDLVPFGDLETSERTLEWRDGARMTTFGLREAMTSSVAVLLPGGASARVPSMPGLAFLKLAAWHDRRLETRRDAVDLATIIGWYSTGHHLDVLYGEAADVLQRYDFDPVLAGAHRLGQDVAAVLGPGTNRALSILDEENVSRLTADMPSTVLDRTPILRALRAGIAHA